VHGPNNIEFMVEFWADSRLLDASVEDRDLNALETFLASAAPMKYVPLTGGNSLPMGNI